MRVRGGEGEIEAQAYTCDQFINFHAAHDQGGCDDHRIAHGAHDEPIVKTKIAPIENAGTSEVEEVEEFDDCASFAMRFNAGLFFLYIRI